jgi:lambda repressor-like predicted transcriptional regulator
VPPNGAAYGEGCVIGHIDTGYTDHGEIWDPRPRILAAQGYDFESDDPDARDPLTGSAPGHGTATASVIMSSLRGPESKFVNGVAPRASLIPVRVSGGVIHLSFANVVRGIHHCVDRGAHVISMSLGGPVASASLERAISRAVSSGVIVLAAAGNVWPNVVYPARYPDVIAVAATNCEGRPWTKSASGAEVDVSAPGESVWRASAEVKNGTPVFDVAPSSGTSYAVANAAGACALWLAFHRRDALIARYRAENLAEIFRRQLLDSCVQPSNWNSKDYGKGIVDAERLLTWPLPTTVSAGSKTIARGKLRRAARLRREPRADAHGARPRAERPANPSAALARAELEFRVATSASWREAYASRARDSASLRALAESEASALLSSRLAGSRRIQAKRHSAKKGRRK